MTVREICDAQAGLRTPNIQGKAYVCVCVCAFPNSFTSRDVYICVCVFPNSFTARDITEQKKMTHRQLRVTLSSLHQNLLGTIVHEDMGSPCDCMKEYETAYIHAERKHPELLTDTKISFLHPFNTTDHTWRVLTEAITLRLFKYLLFI